MRSAIPIGVAVLAFTAVAEPAAAIPNADQSSASVHTRRSTAFITARVNDRSEAVGSGVILSVSPNVIVLTARHLAARKNLSLRTSSGETLRIVAEYEVADRDLALLIASGPCTGCEAVETAEAMTVGQPIHVWGNPQGRPYVMSSGTIADLRPAIPGFATNGRFALTCPSCDVGDSGGGVFDGQGRLLGIITEGWSGLNAADKRVIAEPANQALARVPLEYVQARPSRRRSVRNVVAVADIAGLTASFSECASTSVALALSAIANRVQLTVETEAGQRPHARESEALKLDLHCTLRLDKRVDRAGKSPTAGAAPF